MKRETKVMWAVGHVPNDGSWDRGHTNHTFYWTELEAKLQCPNDAFKPVKVQVSTVTQ